MSRSLSIRPSHAWRLRLAACALALLALHAQRARADWVPVPRTTGGDVVVSYDTTRARLSEGVLEVWTREQGAALRPVIIEDYRRRGLSPVQVQDFGERFAWRLTKWRVDCDKRLARTLAVGDYATDGSATFTTEAAGEEGAIWPDSAVDAATRALCRTAPKGRTTKRSAPRHDRESRPK